MLNSINLECRLCADPELKTAPNGDFVCSIRVANDRGSGDKRKTNFITAVAWKHNAEFLSRNFHKGSIIIIEGEWMCRDFTTQNGEKRHSDEILISRINFTGSNKNNYEEREGKKPDYSDEDNLPY